MSQFISLIFFLYAAIYTVSASEPLAGTLRNTKGQPLKGIKVSVNESSKIIKTDKKGEFVFDSIQPGDILHVNYKDKISDVIISDKNKIHLIVGEDNRVFERESYTGESFRGTLLNHKGKGIRGAMVYASDPFDYVKSDSEGKFVLDNVHPDDTLHIRHDGYLHDIAMDGSKGMFIIIGRDNGRRETDIEVNMGTGNVRLRDYNGPYSMMTAKQLEATGEMDLAMALKWMPGVMRSNGNVTVRNAPWKPVWIIDGLISRDYPGIMVMEVESVVVLKDGAGYGTIGGGGAIVVTTKGSKF